MNRRNLLALLPATGALTLIGTPKNLPAKVTERVASIPAEEALALIQRLANIDLWPDLVRQSCDGRGVTDPEEIQAEIDAWENSLDDLIWAEETLCDLVHAARALLGRNTDNEVIDIEATIIS